MNTSAICDVRDDLHHVENLLKALSFLADSPLVATDLSCALSEIIAVARSSLDVADGRLVAMRDRAQESGGRANPKECVA